MNRSFKEYAIYEVGDIVTGSTPSTKVSDYWNGNYPFYTPGDLGLKKNCERTEKKITKKGMEMGRTIPENSILFTCIGSTIGKLSIAKNRGLTNQQINTVVVYGSFDYNFVYYKLRHESNVIRSIAAQTAVPIINKSDFSKFRFYYPPLPQQKKIAKILSTCDELIEQTEAAIAKYEALKQGMMQDLFTRGIDVETGQLRPSYEQAPGRYKDSELGMIPLEWEVQPLEHYFKNITYGFTNPMPETEEGPFMITAANVINGKINYRTSRKTSRELYLSALTEKSRPKIGDLLLTKDGTLGRLAIVDRDNICINQSVAVIRFNEIEDSKYFKLLLESEEYQKKMLDDAGGSTIKHIYITIVNLMLMKVPKKKKEKEAIRKVIEQIENKIEFEKRSLHKTDKLKKGLMQDLLTGKVEVKV